jgi:hypothetical protein
MSEIESVKPALTVILDDGDFIINSTGPIGKAMSQAILPLAAAARKVTIITDNEMKVMKRNGKGTAAQQQLNGAAPGEAVTPPTRRPSPPAPDIQDQFAADLEAGVVGEAAMGESPTPTLGPSDPVLVPAAPKAQPKRAPRIYQDAAAPPAPELAEAEMERLLEEAAQAEADAVRVAEDQRFQRQQAVQAGADPVEVEAEAPAKPGPRKREPRNLATTGRPCGRCGGGGQIVGESGFQGACPVCLGQGQIKTWDRALKVR